MDVSFVEILIERVNRSNPVNIEVSNPRMTHDECFRLQDVINIFRIMENSDCDNDIIFPADCGLPIKVKFNGGLLMSEIAGHSVKPKQLSALQEICKSGLEVLAYFGEDDTGYCLRDDFTIAQLVSRCGTCLE